MTGQAYLRTWEGAVLASAVDRFEIQHGRITCFVHPDGRPVRYWLELKSATGAALGRVPLEECHAAPSLAGEASGREVELIGELMEREMG